MSGLMWRAVLRYGLQVGIVCFALAFFVHLQDEIALRDGSGLSLWPVVIGGLMAGIVIAVICGVLVQETRYGVRRLAKMVRRMVGGDYSVRLHQTHNPDINEVSRAINALADEYESVVQRVSSERNRVATILANLTDGFISTDTNGMVTAINLAARRMLDVSADVQGLRFSQIVRDYELSDLLRQSMDDGLERTRMLEVGPRRQQLQVKITIVSDEADQPSCVIVLQDLTELHRLERVRRDFVANISHELRTPLASVKLMVETLESVIEDDPEEARSFLRRIDTELDGLTQLVRELLELSRIESGQITLQLRPLDLESLVYQAVERMQPQAERHRIALRLDDPLPDDSNEVELPSALADGDRLMQVMINLLHNAIKFTSPGGRIAASVNRLPDNPARLVVRVTDTGVGIPADEVPRIFERFYKVDKARSGESGTGLGLAISKHIIQAHGGDIWAESIEGEGSVFSFTIPIATGAQRARDTTIGSVFVPTA